MTIEAHPISVGRSEAKELYRKYKEHAHYSQPIDDEIRRAYQLLAQGRLIISVNESIKKAGLNAQKLPNLAIARADAKTCFFRSTNGTGGIFAGDEKSAWRGRGRNTYRLPEGSFAERVKYDGKATVPIIPVHLRPKRGIENYHILWEAEWTLLLPIDPYLLRRIGKGDMWLVVAMWDLTEVERAALSARIGNA